MELANRARNLRRTSRVGIRCSCARRTEESHRAVRGAKRPDPPVPGRAREMSADARHDGAGPIKQNNREGQQKPDPCNHGDYHAVPPRRPGTHLSGSAKEGATKGGNGHHGDPLPMNQTRTVACQRTRPQGQSDGTGSKWAVKFATPHLGPNPQRERNHCDRHCGSAYHEPNIHEYLSGSSRERDGQTSRQPCPPASCR
jgi:hypothetical protein